MATREDQLVREIERIRGDLAENLEAIGDRVAPKKVVGRAKVKAADKLEELGEKVSPRRVFERQTEGLRDRLQSIQASVATRSDDDEGDDEDGPTSGTRVVRAQGRPLSQRPAPVPRSVAEQVRSVRSAEERSPASAVGRPVAAGLVVVGAGVLIARLMRPGGPERQAARRVKEKLDPRQDDTIGAGRGVAGELARPAQESAPPVERRTTKAPKATKQVKKQARTSARSVKAGAAGAAKKAKAQTGAASRSAKGQAKRTSATVERGAQRAAKATKAARPG